MPRSVSNMILYDAKYSYHVSVLKRIKASVQPVPPVCVLLSRFIARALVLVLSACLAACSVESTASCFSERLKHDEFS